jgi:hypothetical protein
MNTATTSRREQRNTKTTVMVDVLNRNTATAILNQILWAQYRIQSDAVADHLVIAPIPGTDDGWGRPRHAVICTEGVGWEQDEYQRILLPGSEGMQGVATTVGVCRLLKECRTGEQINLADHIRTFGDRLEMNFDIWHHRLTVGDTKKK